MPTNTATLSCPANALQVLPVLSNELHICALYCPLYRTPIKCPA